ncbi:MAG: Trk system potassium transporter TrkA [Candidatus Saliniplasma sp.]
MRVLIIGAGEVGYELSESIRRKGHDVILVDKSKRACERAKILDVKVVNGNGARPELLNSLDIKSTNYFFAVTDDNETNLVACSMAKSAGCKTIARINGLDYISKPVSKRFSQIGVDYAVSPELIIAEKISNIINVPSAIDKNLFMGGKINVVEFKVLSNSKIAGKKIKDINFPPKVNLGAIIRENRVLVPHGNDELKEDDTLIVITSGGKAEKKMIKLIGRRKNQVNNAMIVGATDIGINVSKKLVNNGVSVTLIDNSAKKARKAAEMLKDVQVLKGDARDKKVLIEEGILRMDAFASTTASEEFNVLVSLLAKIYGVEKTIATVRELGLKSLIETVGIDFAASPELDTAKTMLRLAKELNPLQAIPIHGGDIHILEMNVKNNSQIKGQSLNESEIASQAIVGAIIREGKTIIPHGKQYFKDGDKVIIFVLRDRVQEVEELF